MPPKFESETATQKKQPPKTKPKPQTKPKPKPRTPVALATHCDDAVKSDGDIGQHELQSTGNVHDHFTARPIDNMFCSLSNPSSTYQLSAETESPPLPKKLLSNVQSADMSAKRNELFRPSVKPVVMNRWSSTSSLISAVSEPSADDVRNAIVRAKQKRVLHRIAGMKLEGETLPQQIYESADEDCEATSHSDVEEQRLSRETQVKFADPASAAADTKPSTDDGSSSTGHASPAAATVPSEPNPLSDVQNVEHSPIPETVETITITLEGTESESGDDDVSQQSEQTRRPISLYPQDTERSSVVSDDPPTVSDVQSSLSADDGCTQSDNQASPPPVAQQLSPASETAFNLRSVKHPQVAPSRKSYMVIKEFVGEKFSFLDNLDDTDELPKSISDCAGEQPVPSEPASCVDTTADQCTSTATEELRTRDRCDENKATPVKTPRKSVVLPNGEILEIIGSAFTFLDDYDEQNVHDCFDE